MGPRYFDRQGILMLVAFALFIAGALVSVGVFDGNATALIAAGLAACALTQVVA